MRNSSLDRMVEFAVERLAQDDSKGSRRLIKDMATSWPNEPALGIAFAMTSAAATLEDVIDSQASIRSSQLAYKLSALVAADVFALQEMGNSPATGQDLLHFWRRVDPYFLNI
ncbi:hypothetical protein N9O61_02915 [Octadecabacter sp.]|nr:hypothetical protein [Octadecabacter sp.]